MKDIFSRRTNIMENQFTQTRMIEVVDEGLRQYMIKVFNYMCCGLCITALAAWTAIHTPLLGLIYKIDGTTGSILRPSVFGWLVTLSPLALAFVFAGVINRCRATTLQLIFWGYCALMGLSLSNILLVYSGASVTRVFLISAATFGSMSLYGYTTKRDLTKVGSFLYMGVWGLIIASLVNIFMQSYTIYYVVSYIGVVVFVGLTAYDLQKIKSLYYDISDTEGRQKVAIAGALNLYLDFVNLFLSLIRIMGDRR